MTMTVKPDLLNMRGKKQKAACHDGRKKAKPPPQKTNKAMWPTGMVDTSKRPRAVTNWGCQQ
jgi:hypothetical protein